LNQLVDITLDTRYAAICGYTRNDLEETFGEHLGDVDREKSSNGTTGINGWGMRRYTTPLIFFCSSAMGFSSAITGLKPETRHF